MLPRFLSTSIGSSFLVSTIDEAIPGHLTIKKIHVTWHDGITLSEMNYLDPRQGLKANIPEVRVDKGLLELLAVFSNWGLITLEAPTIELDQSLRGETGATPPRNSAPSPSEKKTPPSESPAGREEDTPIWDDLAAQLAMHNGRLLLTGGGRSVPTTIVQKAEMNLNLSKGTIKYELLMGFDVSDPQATITGFVNLPTHYDGFGDALVSKNTLDIKKLPLRKILELFPPDSSPPIGRGGLNGNLTLTTMGIHQFNYSGSFVLDNVHLEGGLLGGDRPDLGKITIHLNGERRTGTGLKINGMDLESQLCSLHLEGDLLDREYQLKSNGRVDLPILLSSFPATLNVNSGAMVKSGILDFNLDLENRRSGLNLGMDFTVERFSGLFDERPFIWSPVRVTLSGEQRGPGNITIPSLEITSSFLQAHGRGDLTSFELAGSADLETAFSEIGNIFDCPWRGTGKLDFDLTSKANQLDDLLLTGSMAIDNFSLSREGETYFPAHTLSFKARSDSFLSLLGIKDNRADLRLHFSTWPGTLTLQAENIRRKEKSYSLRYNVSSKLSLDRITSLLRLNDSLSAEIQLKGGLDLHSSGFMENGTLVTRELNCRLDDFVWHQPGTTVRDASISLSLLTPQRKGSSHFALRPLEIFDNEAEFIQGAAGLSGYNFDTGGLFVNDLEVSSTPGTVKVSNLTVTDIRQAWSRYSISLTSQWDLAGIADLLHSMGKIPPGVNFKGKGSISLDSATMASDSHPINAGLKLDNFSLTNQSEQLLSNEDGIFRFQAQGNRDFSQLSINRLSLDSAPLSLDSRGVMYRNTTDDHLELQGEMLTDLQKFQALATNILGERTLLRGKENLPFRIYLPLGDLEENERYRATQLAANVSVDRFQHRGMNFSQMDIPVTMEDGVLKTSVTAELNQGGLALEPRVDFQKTPAVLTDETTEKRVLTDVVLDEPLTMGILRRVHPIFGLLASPSGKIDLSLSELNWPLDENATQAGRFATVIDVSKVSLRFTPFFHDIFSSLGLPEEDPVLDNSLVECKGGEGRVSCSPITITLADSEMSLAGSIGYDQSLNYSLKIPITEGLTGKLAAKYLQSTSLEVEIKGTLDKPEFETKMVHDEVPGDLFEKAGRNLLEGELLKAAPDLLDQFFAPNPQ